MSRARNRKAERLQLRVDEGSKSTIERAAVYAHKSVSEFVVETAVARARAVIAEHDRSRLSEPDWDLFYRALIDPPPPNEALKTAFGRHRGTSNRGR